MILTRHSDWKSLAGAAYPSYALALTRSYVAEDAVYLKGKYTGSDTVLLADAPFNPGKCQELNFIDYSKQQNH